MGHVVSKEGLKPDPLRIEAVLKMEPPTDKASVERLRGTVNYLSKFVPRLSEVKDPSVTSLVPMLNGLGTLLRAGL